MSGGGLSIKIGQLNFQEQLKINFIQLPGPSAYVLPDIVKLLVSVFAGLVLNSPKQELDIKV
jgi:hypothetical protein